MTTLTQGAEAIERLSLHYADLMAAHALLKTLGAAEQAKTEMESARDAAKAALETAKKSLATQKQKLADLEASCADRLEQTNARVMELTDAARAAGAELEKTAAANAAEIRANAEADAREMLARADVRLKEADTMHTAAQEEVGKLESTRNDLTRQIQELEQKLADAKAAAKQIMGS